MAAKKKKLSPQAKQWIEYQERSLWLQLGNTQIGDKVQVLGKNRFTDGALSGAKVQNRIDGTYLQITVDIRLDRVRYF